MNLLKIEKGVIISSYKGHTLFAFILSLIIFQNPLAIALAIIGANLPDFDHEIKRMYVVLISLTGALISIILYHCDLPFYLGIVIIVLGVMFLFSSHRGFTHSFLGIILQSLAIGLILFLASQLVFELNLFNAKIVAISLIILFIAILFVNKKVLFIIFILIMFSIWKFNTFDISFLNCICPIFLGLLSHMILDSFTPSGVRPFIPFSNKKFYKNFGIAMIIILAIIFILIFTNNFDNIFSFINNFFNLNF